MERGGFGQLRMGFEQRQAQGGIAVHDKHNAGVALQCQSRSGDHDRRAVVTAHGVEGNPNLMWHRYESHITSGKSQWVILRMTFGHKAR
jgi:hypothetical protein